MQHKAAFHAMAQLASDNERVNQAIGRLLRRANANGLHPAVMLGFLSHKFDCVLDGLAHIVMSADEDDPDVIEFNPLSTDRN
jgi:hypothetical protein